MVENEVVEEDISSDGQGMVDNLLVSDRRLRLRLKLKIEVKIEVEEEDISSDTTQGRARWHPKGRVIWWMTCIGRN